jgi:hypothetical protein
MKHLITAALLLMSTLSFAQDLSQTMMPKTYIKRSKPILNVALVYYGDFYAESDLERVEKLYRDRFFLATDKTISINVVWKKILPFKYQLIDFPDYRQDYVTDPIRLQRLWYYDNVGMGIMKEVYEQLSSKLKELDALVIITGAQFDGLGFASGRVAVTENPMEIAWGLENGGRAEIQTDARVIDELIHETGHVLFLDHTSNQCQKPGMTYKETLECCAVSPAKNDVMSYCRDRNSVNETKFFGFEECNLKIIKNKIVPAMLSGGTWNIANRDVCL